MDRLTREDLERLDAGDALAHFRRRFALPPGLIYLDGNSLGPLPKATPDRVAATVAQEWGRDLIRSWNGRRPGQGWIDLSRRLGGLIARVIGADPDEVIVADSTSVNIFKLAAAALRLRPGRRTILSEPGNFPTDLYMLQGLTELLGGQVEVRLVERDRLAAALTEDVALLLLTHVHYKTAALHDMAGLTAAAHRAGALTLWDLSHSAGAVELALGRDGADFAVGCGYKYLNGGPGAPAYLYAARRHHADLRNPLSGWMGHAAPFAFGDAYAPAPGMDRMLCGTPVVLGMTALAAGLEIAATVDMALVRAKSVALGDLFIRLVEQRCGPGSFGLASPRDRACRGSHVSLVHPDGYAIVQALIARGVVGDFRAPDILRFGLTPLTLRYVDVWDAVAVLADIVATGAWRQPDFQVRSAVT